MKSGLQRVKERWKASFMAFHDAARLNRRAWITE
jgi:hypothetical protein